MEEEGGWRIVAFAWGQANARATPDAGYGLKLTPSQTERKPGRSIHPTGTSGLNSLAEKSGWLVKRKASNLYYMSNISNIFCISIYYLLITFNKILHSKENRFKRKF